MREIKFRALDIKRNKMEHFENLELSYNAGSYGYTEESYFISAGHNTNGRYGSVEKLKPIIMQYTGLKDKNGVEIYEGDICRLTSSDGQDNIAYVEYKLNCFVFKNYVMTDYTLHNDFMSQFKKETEVIGNIYENKDMIDC